MSGVITRHLLSIELVERLPIGCTLVKDGGPAESRLRPFETQHLEQPLRSVHRYAPFVIMICQVRRIDGAPGTASLAVRMPDGKPFSIDDGHWCSALSPRGRARRYFLAGCFAFGLTAITSISSSGPGATRAATCTALRAGLFGCSAVPKYLL